MRVIAEYVENAKRSTLDGTGKHIFFAINKIDQHPESEVKKAYYELHEVLKNIIEEPKIFKVSSYFGMVAGLYKKGYLQIEDIRKDESIKFIDYEGYPVSGRNIQESDIETIKAISHIDEVKQGLGNYFEEKHHYLIEEVLSTLKRAYELELQELDETVQLLERSLTEDHKEFQEAIEILKTTFDTNIRSLRKELERYIHSNIYGGSNRHSASLLNKITQFTDKKIISSIGDWERTINKNWRADKFSLNRYNAQQKVEDFMNYVDISVETVRRLLIKNYLDCYKLNC